MSLDQVQHVNIKFKIYNKNIINIVRFGMEDMNKKKTTFANAVVWRRIKYRKLIVLNQAYLARQFYTSATLKKRQNCKDGGDV